MYLTLMYGLDEFQKYDSAVSQWQQINLDILKFRCIMHMADLIFELSKYWSTDL